MKEKPYIIRGNWNLDTPCIVKISYGSKYVIAKFMRQSSGLKNIEDALNAYIRGGKNNPNGLYFFLYEYVKKNPGLDFKVETILTGVSPYELLKREQLELEAGRKDKSLLNNQVDVYLPDNSTWIRPIDIVNFNNWFKKHRKDLAQVKRSATIKKKKSAAKKAAKAQVTESGPSHQ
jgi:hypothetical protein